MSRGLKQKRSESQLSFKTVNGWGGKRRGAGRPNKSGCVGHGKREKVDFRKPLHLTIKVRHSKWNLRSGEVFAQFKVSAARAREFGLRILHFSILRDHLHLVVEVANNRDLAAGMRSFGASFAKGIRKIFGGAGAVFAGRYHLRVFRTPTEVRNALAYVLQNMAKHSRLLQHLDGYSSAPYFDQWKTLLGRKMSPILHKHRAARLPTYLSPPQSWLARAGWLRARPV